ncbi:hypothetical protein GQR58_025556 [Nymphon striatum]|nr:hypothetical protein GQR58_025556 [Nymphon striatum]
MGISVEFANQYDNNISVYCSHQTCSCAMLQGILQVQHMYKRTLTSKRVGGSATVSTRQFIKSDFVPLRSLPPSERAGGVGLFSCLKNTSMSASRCCMTIKSREKRSKLVFSVSFCCFTLFFSFLPVNLKSGRLFFLIVALMDLLKNGNTFVLICLLWG